jgi:hypothetical protein
VLYKLPSTPSKRFDLAKPSKSRNDTFIRNVCSVVRAPSASIAYTVPIGDVWNGALLNLLVVP